jgi:hypothetical protein
MVVLSSFSFVDMVIRLASLSAPEKFSKLIKPSRTVLTINCFFF